MNGSFTWRCKTCANYYSPEYATKGTYCYKDAVLTVGEWARIIGCTERALYYQLEQTNGDIAEVIMRMGKAVFVEVKLGGGKND